MEKYRTLPFAMYDLAVYLPGGAITLLIIRSTIESIFGHSINLPFSIDTKDSIGVAIQAVIWMSASYLSGHLAAFASTYLVEKLIHNNLGFPSEIWIDLETDINAKNDTSNTLRKIFTRNLSNFKHNFVNYLIIFAQLPALVPIMIFVIIKPFGFYSPKLPIGILRDVKLRYSKIIKSIPLEKGTRWEKVIEHFVANNCDNAYSRMYNYLVIYGALRLLSLILLLILWSTIVVNSFRFFKFNETQFDIKEFIFLAAMSGTYVLSVMAFAKFNRRYFEETIMALLLAPRKPPTT